ncbi:MAG: helix-turn-helix transcriptional regulator [Cyanothece sp. SIO1E1]|nr:helix-turn-helix transcriptional regulator [Cyanothece sp. SIO1E1]
MQSASLKQNASLENIEAADDVIETNCQSLAESSSQLTESQADEFARWFKALSDPTRLQILNLLARHREPLCVCDIVDQFDIGQPTISHHLKILRQAKFVIVKRQGAFMYYSVNCDCMSALPQAARLIMNA